MYLVKGVILQQKKNLWGEEFKKWEQFSLSLLISILYNNSYNDVEACILYC